MSVWDDPSLSMDTDYVTFENEGDTIKGQITGIYAHTFADGKVAPKLTLDTEQGSKILTAGQFQLRQKLSDLRPNIGDTITVTFTGMNNLGGGKTMKLFDVNVAKSADTPAPTAGAPAPVAAAPTDMTPEQLAAVQLLQASGLST